MSDYVKVAMVQDLLPGSMIAVSGIDFVDTCLVNCEGRYYAVSNICTHKGGPLDRGVLNGRYIVCPWHKASFKVEDGKNNWPADRSLRSFAVKVEDEWIYVRKKPAKRETRSEPGLAPAD